MVVVSSTFSAPAEGIILQKPAIKLIVNDYELGTGTLYITENNVVWGGGVLSAGGPAPTVSLQYPTISLHAIQREPSLALYMVLNFQLRLPELGNMETGDGDADDDDEDFDAEETPITQLRFVPQSEADLQPLYSAMTEGQSLHPDPDQHDDDHYADGEDLDEAEEQFEDAEESVAQGEEAAARLRQLRLEHNGNQHGENYEDAEFGED